MQLSIKDSDLKGVFNLEVNAIVFLLCKDNIWMSIFSRKGPRFVLFAKFFAQQDPFKGTEVRQWPTYRATAARPLQELQLSQSLLNYHLKPFLNRHYCLSGTVVSRPYLALPWCCDFQSCILCRYLFFMVLKSIETHKAGARPISSQSQFSHAMKNTVVQEQPGPFLQAIFHHVRPWMEERSEEWCNRSICLTGGGADGNFMLSSRYDETQMSLNLNESNGRGIIGSLGSSSYCPAGLSVENGLFCSPWSTEVRAVTIRPIFQPLWGSRAKPLKLEAWQHFLSQHAQLMTFTRLLVQL